MRYAQADALRSGAQGLNRARGANAFMNILGGVAGGASMGMQYQQAFGTNSTASSNTSYEQPTFYAGNSSIGREGMTRY